MPGGEDGAQRFADDGKADGARGHEVYSQSRDYSRSRPLSSARAIRELGMAVLRKTVTAYRCERCGYEWLPRFDDAPLPTVCANRKCKSPAWNKPRPSAKRRKRPA